MNRDILGFWAMTHQFFKIFLININILLILVIWFNKMTLGFFNNIIDTFKGHK